MRVNYEYHQSCILLFLLSSLLWSWLSAAPYYSDCHCHYHCGSIDSLSPYYSDIFGLWVKITNHNDHIWSPVFHHESCYGTFTFSILNPRHVMIIHDFSKETWAWSESAWPGPPSKSLELGHAPAWPESGQHPTYQETSETPTQNRPEKVNRIKSTNDSHWFIHWSPFVDSFRPCILCSALPSVTHQWRTCGFRKRRPSLQKNSEDQWARRSVWTYVSTKHHEVFNFVQQTSLPVKNVLQILTPSNPSIRNRQSSDLVHATSCNLVLPCTLDAAAVILHWNFITLGRVWQITFTTSVKEKFTPSDWAWAKVPRVTHTLKWLLRASV